MNTVDCAGRDWVRCTALVALAVLSACSAEKTESSRDPVDEMVSTEADWVRMGYDLGSTYWNKAEKKVTKESVPTLEKAWELDTGAQVTGTPVVSGGRVYFASADLIAVDLVTGKELWRTLNAGAGSSLTLDDGVLYSHDGAGFVRAFDAKDGRQLWEHQGDVHASVSGFSSPIVAGDLVLVGGSSGEEIVIQEGQTATFRGYVLAVNKADGSRAWKKFTVEPPHTGVAIWSTVSVDLEANRVFASTGNNYTGEATDTSDAFLALPLDTGADFAWKQQIFAGDVYVVYVSNGNPDGDFGANPILFEAGGRKLAAGGCKMGDVWVLDRNTGEILKQRNLGPSNAFKGGVFVSGAWDGKSLLFAVNNAGVPDPTGQLPPNAVLLALDPLTLEVKWEREVGPVVYSPITVANGVGFFGNDKSLQVFDTDTGAMLMEFPTEGTIATAPAVSNGYVVFGSGMSWIQSTGGTKYHALKVK